MKDIIRDLYLVNEGASADDVGRAVVDQIERLLPEIIMRISAPKTPSIFAIKRDELRLNRMPKRSRKEYEESLDERNLYSREITWLHQYFDGTPSANANLFSPQSDRDWVVLPPAMPQETTHTIPFLDSLHPRGSQQLDLLAPTEERIKSHSPYLLALKQAARLAPQKFVLDKRAKLKVILQGGFDDFARSVELAANEFTKGLGLDWAFVLSVQNDLEIPDWEKIVLEIIPTGSSFDESMELWDLANKKIRDEIEAKKNALGKTLASKLTEFGKNFYIDMNLD